MLEAGVEDVIEEFLLEAIDCLPTLFEKVLKNPPDTLVADIQYGGTKKVHTTPNLINSLAALLDLFSILMAVCINLATVVLQLNELLFKLVTIKEIQA